MLVKAVNTIMDGKGTFKPGDVLSVPDNEAQRLFESGAAIPVKKVINLELTTIDPVSSDTGSGE